ncbi:tetratricopeptide repeat protein, partial [bacterium]|nr:tetratricopeptide repeat protein [bacterium]
GYFLDSLAWGYYQKGDYEKALELLEKAMGFVSDDPVIFDHLGDAYQKKNLLEKALHSWEKSYNLNKDKKVKKKIKRVRKELERKREVKEGE